MSEPTVNQMVRAWWRSVTSDTTPTNIQALAAQGAAELRKNEEFCRLYLDATLEQFVCDQGRRMFAADRMLVRHGDTYTAMQELRAEIEAEAKESSFFEWREFDPTSREHIRLPKMEKLQVIAAADYRESIVNANGFEAAFLRLVAGRMQDGQHVEDVWREEELRDLRRKIVVSFSFGLQGTDKKITRRKAA